MPSSPFGYWSNRKFEVHHLTRCIWDGKQYSSKKDLHKAITTAVSNVKFETLKS